MYKAQSEAGQGPEGATPPPNPDAKDDVKGGDNNTSQGILLNLKEII